MIFARAHRSDDAQQQELDSSTTNPNVTQECEHLRFKKIEEMFFIFKLYFTYFSK